MTFQVSIICDHTRQPLPAGITNVPAPRTVSTIIHAPRPTDREVVGWLEWRELVPGDPAQEPALQTPFGEMRRRWKELGGRADLGGVAGLPPMDYGTRWRFSCPDCRDTLPVRGERMERVLTRLAQHGQPELSLFLLAKAANTV